MKNMNNMIAYLLMLSLIFSVTFAAADTVKLVFIHHSTGGNWLADPNTDQPYGGLGAALMNNNYFVSATNYGWGPDSIGDRTDITNWIEWFTGPNSSGILSALYAENRQNIGDFGSWSRLATDPGGENKIIMFKSCFPNSDLFGNPDDPPASEANDWEFSVSNAKAVYNKILSYFAARPDKLFVVITAPPKTLNEYSADMQTPAERAANARAFNNWLINNWLSGYSKNNVAVFDYFNVLTHPDNHHRIVGGNIEHYTSPQSGNFAYYPSGDSHPSTEGHQKAATEFVPLLNYYYNKWTGTAGGGCISVADDLALNLCVMYQGVRYGTTLDFYANPDDPGELYWKLNIATFHNLSGDPGNCITVPDDLSLSLCAVYQGKNYSFTLNYSPLQRDPAELYWKMDISTFKEIEN